MWNKLTVVHSINEICWNANKEMCLPAMSHSCSSIWSFLKSSPTRSQEVHTHSTHTQNKTKPEKNLLRTKFCITQLSLVQDSICVRSKDAISASEPWWCAPPCLAEFSPTMPICGMHFFKKIIKKKITRLAPSPFLSFKVFYFWPFVYFKCFWKFRTLAHNFVLNSLCVCVCVCVCVCLLIN